MDVLSAIETRREITKFKDVEIPAPVMEKLVTALYKSPAGNNLPSREFIIVTDRSKLLELSKTTPYMKWLEEAAAGIVMVGNPELSKYWLQDASISGAFLWLTATSLDLGAAWGAVYHSEDEGESHQREQYVRERLEIPAELRVVAILGVGYPEQQPGPKELYPLSRVLHNNMYSNLSNEQSK